MTVKGAEEALLTNAHEVWKWARFLATAAPGKLSPIDGLAKQSFQNDWQLATPPLSLFCDHQACDGERFFDCLDGGQPMNHGDWVPKFLSNRCRHCQITAKTFALIVKLEKSAKHGQAHKIGELPPFGPYVPTRLNALIGPDRDFFFKGRRAESQGMGIGAFGYYRRVVENQKNRIIDEIIKVCNKLGAKPKVIEELGHAKAETQFHKAVQMIKKGIPEALKIRGHNPLLLLHSALSEGLHAQSDEQCLELATSIRVVMTELAERLDQALTEQADLNDAVSRLLKSQSKKPESAPQSVKETRTAATQGGAAGDAG